MLNKYSDIETAPKAMLQTFDLRDLPTSFYDNPFPTYHIARRECPVFHLPDGGGIFLTRYKDLDRIYKDTTTFSSDKKVDFKPKFGDSPLFDHHTSTLVFNDPSLHTRVRKTIVGARAPRVLKPLAPQVEGYVDDMLTKINEGDVFNAVDDYASLLPIRVIATCCQCPKMSVILCAIGPC